MRAGKLRKDQKAIRARQAPQAQRVMSGQQARREPKVTQGPPVLKAIKVKPGRPVSPASVSCDQIATRRAAPRNANRTRCSSLPIAELAEMRRSSQPSGPLPAAPAGRRIIPSLHCAQNPQRGNSRSSRHAPCAPRSGWAPQHLNPPKRYHHRPFIFTGTAVARKALPQEAHCCAASGLDPRRHPGALASMLSMPEHATQIPVSPIPRAEPRQPHTNQTHFHRPTPHPARPSSSNIRDARRMKNSCAPIFVLRDILRCSRAPIH